MVTVFKQDVRDRSKRRWLIVFSPWAKVGACFPELLLECNGLVFYEIQQIAIFTSASLYPTLNVIYEPVKYGVYFPDTVV